MRLITESFLVGSRTVTMSVAKLKPGDLSVLPEPLNCVWSPDMPHSLTRQERRQYIKGRDRLLRKLGTAVGGQVAVIDL